MYALAMLAGEGSGLTLKQVLQDIPHDAGAIIVYLLIAGFAFMLWYGNRPEVVKRFENRSPGAEPGSETSAGNTSSSGAGSNAGDKREPANPH